MNFKILAAKNGRAGRRQCILLAASPSAGEGASDGAVASGARVVATAASRSNGAVGVGEEHVDESLLLITLA